LGTTGKEKLNRRAGILKNEMPIEPGITFFKCPPFADEKPHSIRCSPTTLKHLE
jgi:hypothetical protein